MRCRKNRLPDGGGRTLLGVMIRGGFLTAEERRDLTELARDGLAEHRLARRANALVLLYRGMSCEEVGRVLLIDDDTIRTWHRLFEEDGVDGLAGFNYGGRACHLTLEQQATLKTWVGDTLPTRMVGAWIEHEFEVVYESRSGLIALLHRLGLEHRKPQAVSRKLDPAKQKAFITRTSSFPRVSRWRLCHSKEPSARDRKMRDFCQGFRALGSMDRDLVWLYCVIEDVVRQILGETRLRSRGPTPELTDVE